MRTKKALLLSLLVCAVALPATAAAWDRFDIDQDHLSVSNDRYVVGVSNDGEQIMLLRILDSGNVSMPPTQHQIYLDAMRIAQELELEEFLAVYGTDEELFRERLDRKLNDLRLLEKLGLENGETAPNLVRFFTET